MKNKIQKSLTIGILQLTLFSGLMVSIYGQSDSLELKQSKIMSLRNDVRKLHNQISETDSLSRLEQSSHKKWIENWNQDLKKRQEELQALSQKVQDLEKEISGETAKQYGLENHTKEIEARLKYYRGIMISSCKDLASMVEAGLPWKQTERLERIHLLQRDLESATTSVEESFTRLQAIYKEEIQSGDEVAVFNTSMTRLNGSTVNAQVLKIGNQWMVYMDEEEKNYGILYKDKSDYKWKEDLSFDERRAVKEAIRVKLAKKAPQLVTLPLSIAIEN